MLCFGGVAKMLSRLINGVEVILGWIKLLDIPLAVSFTLLYKSIVFVRGELLIFAELNIFFANDIYKTF